jgi:tripartite-type tricarboxylate transporter receptor subunit TctC
MRAYLAICVVVGAGIAGGVCAQTYPGKPIRVINPYTAGGGVDALLRPVTQKMGENMKVTMPVDNRPGANGMIGTEVVARAAPDGYTLVVGTTSSMCMNINVYAKVPYDPVKDFAPISKYAEAPFLFAVHPSVPATNIKELIALAKAQPNKITYGTFGVGSIPHLGTEMLSMTAGIKMLHVPYKGTVPAVTDLVAGNVMLDMDSMQALMPYVRSKRIRALGLAAKRRSAAAPDLPTIAESGLPGFEVVSWYGLLAPANTPRDIVARLHAEVVKALAAPEVRDRI